MPRPTTRSHLLSAAGLAAVPAVWRLAEREQPGESGVLAAPQVQRLYDRLAPAYVVVAGAYQLLGARRLHRRAVCALGFRPGDTAVDLGCGTGANLAWLVEAVGPEGRVVGVDLSEGMLARARRLAERRGWRNVELVQADMREWAFPQGVRGVVATFALEMMPGYDDVIRRAVAALPAGGRLAVSGLRRPEGWPEWLVRLGEWVNRPFGVTRAYEAFRPWEAARRHAREVRYEEALLGAVYLSVGEATAGQP